MHLHLFESLLKAESREELIASAQKATEALEFECFVYGLRMIKPGELTPHDLTFGTYPEHWLEHYLEQEYERIDPSVEHCFNHTVPVIWRDQFFSGNRPIEILHDEAVQSGVSAGACFPIHSSWLNGAGVVGLASSEATDKGVGKVVEKLALGQLFAGYLHEGVRKVEFAKESQACPAVKLSSREKECLLWSSRGKTSSDIAQILKISERTVFFHVANACEKLGAVNRQQAVVRAISFKLITP